MEKSNIETKVVSKRGKSIARVRLSCEAQAKLIGWQNQIQEKFNGMLKLNSSELVSIIINNSSNKLTSAALGIIKNKKLTDVQRVKWMLQRLEESKKEGGSVTLNELIKETQESKKKCNSKVKKASVKSLESTEEKGVC